MIKNLFIGIIAVIGFLTFVGGAAVAQNFQESGTSATAILQAARNLWPGIILKMKRIMSNFEYGTL